MNNFFKFLLYYINFFEKIYYFTIDLAKRKKARSSLENSASINLINYLISNLSF